MIIHDNRSQYISHEFKQILFENNCKDVPAWLKNPETNGKAERFVGLVRNETLRLNNPSFYSEGKRVIEKFVYEYNHNRYQAVIKFLKPADVFKGRGEMILKKDREN